MERQRPLEGIRVIDFAWVQAGPWIGRFLASYGAQVIRIESAVRPDYARLYPLGLTNKDGTHMDLLFNNVNCDKLGITLNLSTSKGIEIAKKLISISDIVIDNFSSGQMEKFGLDYENLVKVKRDIIAVSLPAFGKTGPYKDFSGYGTGIQAVIGLNSVTGFPHRQGGIMMPLADIGPSPTHPTVAILAALHYRNRTGKGQFIEASQVESGLGWMGTMLLDYSANNRVQTSQGNRVSYAAPHGVFRCQGEDRWCAIAVLTDNEWKAFCSVINQAWTQEERFGSLLKRKENEDELEHLINEWTKDKTAWDVMKMMQVKGVPSGVVESTEDLMLFDEQVRARNYYVTLEHQQGPMVCENITIGLSKTPGEVRRVAPTMGQDNEYVYKEILGMSEDEINQCYVDGTFS